MNQFYIIQNDPIDQSVIRNILDKNLSLSLSDHQQNFISQRRTQLLKLLENNDKAIYGINTGFGSLCNTVVPDHQLSDLQANLVRSHACGFGDIASPDLGRLVLLLKIISLSKGYSAIRPELIHFLIKLYNLQIYPVIPKMGSLGASGDLAPLAHLSLPCLGEGKVYYQNEVKDAIEIFKIFKIDIPYLQAKEGLALLNGTQFSLALLLHAFWTAKHCYDSANMIAALSMEAFNSNISYLHPEIHQIRNQNGQIQAAQELRKWFDGSDIQQRKDKSVQDPYSFRCAPQVHGASLDAINYCCQIIDNEINAVTDNPLLISTDEVLSGGNFHAQPLALASDFLCLALAELASISERRIYQLVCGLRGLPDFLTNEPGLNSGFMIVQYAAAAAVSMNKQLATPSSVDSIISSKAQEDHVSMAANAGIKCNQISELTEQVLAMEWMTACRAWTFRKNWKLNDKLEAIVTNYHKWIPFKVEDYIPSDDYDKAKSYLRTIN